MVKKYPGIPACLNQIMVKLKYTKVRDMEILNATSSNDLEYIWNEMYNSNRETMSIDRWLTECRKKSKQDTKAY